MIKSNCFATAISLVVIAFFTLLSCSNSKQELVAEESGDLFMSAYDKDLMYVITNNGLGNFKLGQSFDELQEHIPVAETQVIDEEDDYQKQLIRLPESETWHLQIETINNEVLSITFYTDIFSTESGIAPQLSSLADLKNKHKINTAWVPDSGTLYISVDNFPQLTFIFEDERLMKYDPETEPDVSALPQDLMLGKIYLYKEIK